MKFDRTETWKTVAYVGAALAAAGLIRWQIQEVLLLPSKILMIGGGAILLVSAAVNWRGVLGFFGKRSTKQGANLTVSVVAVLVILVLVNFLGQRYHKRWDLTEEKLYSLSDQTKQIVGGLKEDVVLMKFDKTPNLELRDRMAEYARVSKRIRYEFVDPQEKPEIARQYDISRMGETILVSGARTEKLDGTEEQDITNAILKMTRSEVKTICFVEGHGEKATSSSDAEGYSAVSQGLTGENYQVRQVNLVAENGVPANCTVLVIAGPKKAFFPQEEEMVQKYLSGGGKLFLMMDPDTDPKLGGVLAAWNVKAGNDTVVDNSGMGQLIGMGPAAPLVITYGEHPIARNFTRTMTFFPLARSVAPADKELPEPVMVELLKTAPQSWAETNLVGGKAKFDEGADTKGPITLGIAANRKAGEKEARLVVIGDSDFAANRFVGSASNWDFFLNTVNWLAQDEDLISVRPKKPTNRRVNLTASQQNVLFWFSVVLLPGVVLLAGAWIWWKRR